MRRLTRFLKRKPESLPDRVPEWVDSFHQDRFRVKGRLEPEKRRVFLITPSAIAYVQAITMEMRNWFVRVRIEPVRDAGGYPAELMILYQIVTDIYPEFDLIDDSQEVRLVVDRRTANLCEGCNLDVEVGVDGKSSLKIMKASISP